jgi:tetraacyldisaccharide 4'-kinase
VPPGTGWRAGWVAKLEALLNKHWARRPPSFFARLLQPLSWLYAGLALLHKATAAPPQALLVPVLVVGNFTAGGAGKTPTVIALVQALTAAGHKPGVISRGHGRKGRAAIEVTPNSPVHDVGDEPLLVRRRTGAPVWVARDRPAAARALCQHHPEVDVLVADDGLQHHALTRQAAVVVFDERGTGNSLLLPAGPLREPIPLTLPTHMRVLYTAGRASTALPGALATRQIALAWPLAAWQAENVAAAVPLSTLQAASAPALLAAAGIAAPEKFFAMLEAIGLRIQRLHLADHFDFANLPWPKGIGDVLVTEKDAVKINHRALGDTRVWVVPLDLVLPAGFVSELMGLLNLKRNTSTTNSKFSRTPASTPTSASTSTFTKPPP